MPNTERNEEFTFLFVIILIEPAIRDILFMICTPNIGVVVQDVVGDANTCLRKIELSMHGTFIDDLFGREERTHALRDMVTCDIDAAGVPDSTPQRHIEYGIYAEVLSDAGHCVAEG